MCQDQIKIKLHPRRRNLDAFTITLSHNFPRLRLDYYYSFFILTSSDIPSFCGASQPCMYRVSAALGLKRYQTNFPLLHTGNVIIQTSKRPQYLRNITKRGCFYGTTSVTKFSA